MNGYYDDYYDVALEDIEDDDAFPEFFEDDGELDIERRRRGRSSSRKAPPPGARGKYNQPPPSREKVSDAQLRAVVTRIENDIKKLNEVDKTLNTRINAGNARLDRHAAVIKKESAARKKDYAKVNDTLLLSAAVTAALSLIFRPKTKTVTANTEFGLAKDDKVLVEENDFLKSLLPAVLPAVTTIFAPQISGLLRSGGGMGSTGSAGSSSGL